MSMFIRYIILTSLLLTGAGFSQSAIAVMDFEPSGIPAHEASLLSDRLRNELVRLGAYRVVEREMMTEILAEQGFQQSGCTSSECLVEAGRLIGVRRIIGGRIGNIGSVYTVSARLIDVETGELIRVTDYDTNQGARQILSTGMAEVAKVLSGMAEEPESHQKQFGKMASAINAMRKSIRGPDLQNRLFLSSGIALGNQGFTSQIGYIFAVESPSWFSVWSYPVLGYEYAENQFHRRGDYYREVLYGPIFFLYQPFQIKQSILYSLVGGGYGYYDARYYEDVTRRISDYYWRWNGSRLHFSGKIGFQTSLLGIPFTGSLQYMEFPFTDHWQWYVTAGIRF